MKLQDVRKIMNIPDETGLPVCVIDDGTNTALIPGSIAVNYNPVKQADYHGTCSALIVYMASRAELHCFRYSRKKAIQYCAEKGIRIISYSMRSTNLDSEEAELIKKHQILFIAAAGNSGKKGVEYPAKNDLTIAVAAYDAKGQYIEPYSSKGPEVDETAYTDWEIKFPGSTVTFDGTSAAAPVIAGCLSVYLKYYPDATIDECREFLKVNSKDIGAPGLDNESGWGLFRFPDKMDIEGVVKIPTICIDAGHGGLFDPGAINGQRKESEINLQIAKKIEAILTDAGMKVVMTREQDVPLGATEAADLGSRVSIAEGAKADVFVSIHCNSAVNSTAHGAETLYYPGSEKGKTLAEGIQNCLVKTGLDNRGIKERGDLFVLKHTTMPAVLVEVAFMSHHHDRALLTDPIFQDKAARAIAEGTAAFLGIELPEVEEQPTDEINVPVWAREAVMWGIANGLIDTQQGSSDWYRFITVLHRYDDKLRG